MSFVVWIGLAGHRQWTTIYYAGYTLLQASTTVTNSNYPNWTTNHSMMVVVFTWASLLKHVQIQFYSEVVTLLIVWEAKEVCAQEREIKSLWGLIEAWGACSTMQFENDDVLMERGSCWREIYHIRCVIHRGWKAWVSHSASAHSLVKGSEHFWKLAYYPRIDIIG